MSTVGNNIKFFRKQKGMSIRELAIKARIGTQTVTKYETGEQIPDTSTIMKISTVLDIPASELLEHVEPNMSGIDQELESLINELGIKKTKLILRRAKEFTEEDFLHVMHMLEKIKKT
ncbi:helix-turn-helix transcriptional regulator [Bacillus carboniphilus]|uniref:Helix-turn-helix transcriptional regulator n=1 Tax=Bacillus carboniphilus TaxID=86663 RepID=A0ABY9JPB2_9BACI|nr:helix-turn-helix transcriptional regulator [Bacillus carboniphilus]WLR41245.1 helix-turn-helix transcriptional regulator [Bacillus carboniphilus]